MFEQRSRPAVLARLAVALLAGALLVAAGALPWLLGSGLLVDRVGSAESKSLPAATIARVEAPVTGNTKVLAADGSLITEFYTRNRTVVTSDQIAPVMKQALVDVEDARFYQHGALDPVGTLRALVTDASSGGAAQGGSTLIQQLVKQTLVQSASTPAEQRAAVADTLSRKITEAKLAVQLDQDLSKDDILTRYLDTVYFGHGAYGVEAAAETYFSVPAAQLSTLQAATLAGLVQDPSGDDPIEHPQAAQQRRNEVLQRMNAQGHLSAADLQTLSAQPVTTTPGAAPPQGCANAQLGGFFCQYVQTYLSGLGIGQAQLDDGGLTVQTTLEPAMQRAGDQAVLQTLPLASPLAGMYTVVQPGTGKVLAMSVNRRYGCTGTGCTSVDLNTTAARGAGSTYKLFTAAYALQHGYTMGFTQTTSDPYVSSVFKEHGGTTGAPYTVTNAGTYPPTLDMADALVRSSNTYFVGLEDHLGAVDGPVHEAQQLGDSSITDDVAAHYVDGKLGSFTLGPQATSPLALADAYATVFSGGTQCDPTPLTGVLGPDGRALTEAGGTAVDTGAHCTPDVLPRNVADTLAQVMRGDVQSNEGTARRAAVPGHDIAGKTGTAQQNYSIAFVGSTPEYTASVMVENPTVNQDVGGFGGDKGAQIWHDAMAPVLAGQATAPIPAADPALLGVAPGAPCTFTEGDLPLAC